MPPIQPLEYPFYYYPSPYHSVFQVVSFPQVSPLKPSKHLSSPPYVPHVLPISVFLTWSPEWYLFLSVYIKRYSYNIINDVKYKKWLLQGTSKWRQAVFWLGRQHTSGNYRLDTPNCNLGAKGSLVIRNTEHVFRFDPASRQMTWPWCVTMYWTITTTLSHTGNSDWSSVYVYNLNETANVRTT
jgi:hypothetical protein